MTEISQKRLATFAGSAIAFSDVRGIIAALQVICTDCATLQRENRGTAVAGAQRTLALWTRRLCATAASSREDSEAKIDVLARFNRLYHGGNGAENLLIGVMIGSAIALETAAWPASSSQHRSSPHA